MFKILSTGFLFLMAVCFNSNVLAQPAANTTYYEYYEDGKVKLAIPLEGETLQGEGKMYYPDGELMCEFYMNMGKITEVFNFYNQDGTLAKGPIKYHDAKGTLLFEGKMVNGKPDGEFLEYRPDGSVATKYVYIRGKVIKTITP